MTPFTDLFFKVLCGDLDLDYAITKFCDERGIEEGGWAHCAGVVVYMDWTNRRSYVLGKD